MKNNYLLIFAFIIGISILGFLTLSKPASSENSPNLNNVTENNGRQNIEIIAKGGYSPRVSLAKANMPTTLKVKTNGTFDCSSSLTIPQLNFTKLLSNSETIEIPLPAQKPGSVIRGLCGMGMYNFEIQFS